MNARFWKMHGAGNDFVLFDDRDGSLPWQRTDWLRALADRRRGIGCEGFILLQQDPAADFRMRFFNPDGREADLCGNGARCAARLARDLGLGRGDTLRFSSRAGGLRARVEANGSVSVDLPDAAALEPSFALEVAGTTWETGFVVVGVPHAVLEAPDARVIDLDTVGRAVRHHPRFTPAGANVNVATVAGPGALELRTYERGVEAESGACGTGAVAAAIVLAARGRVKAPVDVRTRDGDRLRVQFTATPDGATAISLQGPACYVYEGTVPLPGD